MDRASDETYSFFQRCLLPRAFATFLLTSVFVLFTYAPLVTDYIYFNQNPASLHTYTQSQASYSDHLYDDVLQMSTNATLFVSRCRTQDFWRLAGDESTFDMDEESHNVVHNVKPVFRRVKSGYGYACPRMPTMTNLSLPKTALQTFPRSGNTWTRHVLQELTGILTGSVYHAKVLLEQFPGEGHEEGVLVIKTHVAKTKNIEQTYDKLIIIIRNPFKSLVSFYQLSVLRGGMLDNQRFDVQSKAWNEFIQIKTPHWTKFIERSIFNSVPKMVFFYEDLTTNFFQELLRMSFFLKSDKIIDFSFCCALKNQEGSFHKNHTQKEDLSDFYTLEQRKMVNEGIDQVIQSLRKQNPSIADYLSSYKFV